MFSSRRLSRSNVANEKSYSRDDEWRTTRSAKKEKRHREREEDRFDRSTEPRLASTNVCTSPPYVQFCSVTPFFKGTVVNRPLPAPGISEGRTDSALVAARTTGTARRRSEDDGWMEDGRRRARARRATDARGGARTRARDDVVHGRDRVEIQVRRRPRAAEPAAHAPPARERSGESGLSDLVETCYESCCGSKLLKVVTRLSPDELRVQYLCVRSSLHSHASLLSNDVMQIPNACSALIGYA